MYSDVASSSKLDSEAASAPPTASTQNAPADYRTLLRALGHRRFSEGYAPNTSPVALARRNASFTPRQLYLKMSKDLKMRRNTETAVLTTAIRAFVRLEDYAAALVVLRGIPAGIRASELAQLTEAALHPLACRIYMERDSPRRRLTRALLGAPSLSAAGWGGAWDMPEHAKWLTARLVKRNTPMAEAEADLVEEVESGLRPLAFILRQMLRIHGGATKRRIARPWREEEARAVEEMDPRRGKRKTKRPAASTKPKTARSAPKARHEIPLWEGEKL
ncbi:hypothetical protein K438DRAFT_1796112 [Mycena galopus ATCC 62051]|nr:hypothetical protein K438DRAFT_1796112 [Mycena galopus ATCC 62051]